MRKFRKTPLEAVWRNGWGAGCGGVRLGAALRAEVLYKVSEVQRRPSNYFPGLILLAYLLKIEGK